ncbi:hypothetical protein Tco_0581338 [Tanacetum coccineum]
MDDPNITMEEYVRLKEEKAQRHGQTFNWQTATFGKVENYKDEDACFIDFETEFPAIVFDNTITSDTSLLCAPTVSPPNKNKIDFKISLDESDDEDYTVIFDKNSFSYKIIFVNDLKKDSENDEILKPSSFELTVDCLDDLDYFNDFKNEFPAIVYNDSLTSKPELEIEPPVSSEHVSKFETSLSEYDEVEQNVLHFSNSSPLDKICPNDPKMIKDNDDNIFITQPFRYNEIKRSSELQRENHNKTKKVINEKILIILDANIMNMAPLPAADQRHPWLRYQVEGYTEGFDSPDEAGFSSEVEDGIYWRGAVVTVFSWVMLGGGWHRDNLFWYLDYTLSRRWQRQGLEPTRMAGPAPSYVLIRDPVRRLCHKMIAYSFSGREQTPEKEQYGDLAETMIWYILKRTRVELIRAF